MECLICAEEFTPKRATAKYCSEKCKQIAKRRSQNGDDTVIPASDTLTKKTDTLSDTDKLFNDWRPGYYIFKESRKKTCVFCKKDFETQLRFLRFCSPDCQKQIMVMIATNGNPKALNQK